MELVITNKLETDLTDFCNQIIMKMQEYIMIEVNQDHLEVFDNFINQKMQIPWVSQKMKRPLKTGSLLKASCQHLKVNNFNNQTYIIKIDSNATIPETYAKFIDIAKLVNYGNIQLSPYPIITKMMNYFADNLDKFYIDYSKGELV
mgnify:CR=1 FL=1